MGITEILNFMTAIIWAICKMVVALIATSSLFIVLKPLVKIVADIIGEVCRKTAETYKIVKEAEREDSENDN